MIEQEIKRRAASLASLTGLHMCEVWLSMNDYASLCSEVLIRGIRPIVSIENGNVLHESERLELYGVKGKILAKPKATCLDGEPIGLIQLPSLQGINEMGAKPSD